MAFKNIKNLGSKILIFGLSLGLFTMSKLNDALNEFRDFKTHAPTRGILGGTFDGLKRRVVVLIPNTTDIEERWNITLLLLALAWSNISSGSVITGALLSLLTMFSENPISLVRILGDDPDINVQVFEVTNADRGRPEIAARGADYRDVAEDYKRAFDSGPKGRGYVSPFSNERDRPDTERVRSAEGFQVAVSSIIIQIWTLLAKAVTAPDTARASENRRWLKFTQQRRVSETFRLVPEWLDVARTRIAEDISIRRFMVEVLVDIRSTPGTKSRLIEMIADIGNYIQEAGLAGFFLTIKFGIETKYPALALNEFQSDLSTVLSLMKLYKSIGEKAPFMVLLEESIQTKFAPGNYPLLWSYAMGVGSVLDPALGNLNFHRGYVATAYFHLGQEIVGQMSGNVDTSLADDLGITQEQRDELKRIIHEENPAPTGAARLPRAGLQNAPQAIEPADGMIGVRAADDDRIFASDGRVEAPIRRTAAAGLGSQAGQSNQTWSSARPGLFEFNRELEIMTNGSQQGVMNGSRDAREAFLSDLEELYKETANRARPQQQQSKPNNQQTASELELING
ncbi:nucleocapsid protein [Wufeng Typhlomys cinereus jeilongvirus 1]|uniref:Nucleocapsid n=1 Tax=Wufeng Typhlomys cinereus jeilongvirus 1 TaxID=2928989 RepID=A0A8T9KLE3_9MONO|nr:nucleocapsid protein [Wufeng Typhlomys cinereus jeilongvirus 1]